MVEIRIITTSPSVEPSPDEIAAVMSTCRTDDYESDDYAHYLPPTPYSTDIFTHGGGGYFFRASDLEKDWVV